jgi:hypothetical protein
MHRKRQLRESLKKKIAGKQNYKCANSPNIKLEGIDDYDCLLWLNGDGSFDISGYEIDHIEEHCISANDNEDNLQALCSNCHKVKTKNFMMNYGNEKLIEDIEYFNFVKYMDVMNKSMMDLQKKLNDEREKNEHLIEIIENYEENEQYYANLIEDYKGLICTLKQYIIRHER